MIGILGGTFDPVHYGHLRPAMDVRSALGLADVRFIPVGTTTHREQPEASAAQRQAMLLRAIEDVDGLRVDDREIKRNEPSYMIDTLRSLKTDFPAESFCLIIGIDAFLKLESWREWRSIVELVNLVVTYRPNFNLDSLIESELKDYLSRAKTDKQKIMASDSGLCYFCPVTQLDISSTMIRQMVKLDRPLNYLLPDTVITYLTQNELYR